MLLTIIGWNPVGKKKGITIEFHTNIFFDHLCPSVLQSSEHPSRPGGPGGVERLGQMSRHPGSFCHTA